MFWKGIGFRSASKRTSVSPVEFMILSLLTGDEALTGGDIKHALNERFRNIWECKTGTLYPALTRLKARELITDSEPVSESKTDSDGEKPIGSDESVGPQRKRYLLTQKGRNVLSDVTESFDDEIDFMNRYLETIARNANGPFRFTIVEKIVESLARMLEDEQPPFPPPLHHHHHGKRDPFGHRHRPKPPFGYPLKPPKPPFFPDEPGIHEQKASSCGCNAPFPADLSPETARRIARKFRTCVDRLGFDLVFEEDETKNDESETDRPQRNRKYKTEDKPNGKATREPTRNHRDIPVED